MIYVHISGRLGNQMYYYAFARALQTLQKDEICFDYDAAKYFDDGWRDSLKLFNVKPYRVLDENKRMVRDNANIIQKAVMYIFKKFSDKYTDMAPKAKFEEKWQWILNRFGIYMCSQGAYKIKKSLFKNKFVFGNCENPGFFDDIRSELLLEFTPKEDTLDKNDELLNIIKSTNSVCVSIRRGDFVSNSKVAKDRNICTIEYFKEAVEKFKDMFNNDITVIMFSDDIDWVKKNINIHGVKVCFESGNNTLSEKIKLMSSCKHFVISNSTFSWWTAYLGQYKDKVIIGPDRWYNNGYETPLMKIIDIRIKA